MNRIITLIVLLMSIFLATANDYVESFNVISNKYSDKIQDIKIIRPINGGTVIIPEFDESCPEELKAPFAYACKIVEEYMPTCLPLKVKVSCGRINSSTNAISKVRSLCKENFGNSMFYKNAQMSVIKGVILAELCRGSYVTYLDSIPNVEFLTKFADIDISYNSLYLDEISFSLDAEPGQKYDFVSLAIRDLLIGLGISHSYRYNSAIGGLQNPAQELTPFETSINDLLGNYDSPGVRLLQATKGELVIKKNLINGKDLKLYAPSTWNNNTSLKYFIPLDGCDISSILAYDFCKGQVTRSLSDGHSDFFFRQLLGWRPEYTVSTDTPNSTSSGGSTAVLMPYNGSLSFNNRQGIKYNIPEYTPQMRTNAPWDTDIDYLYQYIYSFLPINPLDKSSLDSGSAISILKKDGSWDVVKMDGDLKEDLRLSMSNLKFNFDSEEYARTIDGYLRARVTFKQRNYQYISYSTMYFVIDYLPQKVSMNYSFIPPSISTLSTINSNDMVRIFFSNTEGIERIVLERLRQGARVPSKIEITDFKKGYYDTAIDRTTTFTAIGYNANGTSRSIPITISATSNLSSLDFNMTGQLINIQNDDENTDFYSYEIKPLIPTMSQTIHTGTTTGKIDISPLEPGLYLLTVVNSDYTRSGSFKFKKQYTHP